MIKQVVIDVLEKTPEQLVYLIDGVRRRVQYVLDDDQLYLDRDNGNVLIRNMTYAATAEATDVAGDGKNSSTDGWGCSEYPGQ